MFDLTARLNLLLAEFNKFEESIASKLSKKLEPFEKNKKYISIVLFFELVIGVLYLVLMHFIFVAFSFFSTFFLFTYRFLPKLFYLYVSILLLGVLVRNVILNSYYYPVPFLMQILNYFVNNEKISAALLALFLSSTVTIVSIMTVYMLNKNLFK